MEAEARVQWMRNKVVKGLGLGHEFEVSLPVALLPVEFLPPFAR